MSAANQDANAPQPSSLAAAWRHAHALAVVLERSTSGAKDVVSLGDAWAAGVELWLATGLPYLILTATSRKGLHSPSALMARDADALRFAVGLVCDRGADVNILWANCGSEAAWEIVYPILAERMPTEGSA